MRRHRQCDIRECLAGDIGSLNGARPRKNPDHQRRGSGHNPLVSPLCLRRRLRLTFHDLERIEYLQFIARVTSHIPDKGQVTVRYYGLCANAHRGKVKKASLGPFPLRIMESELRPVPFKG